MRNDASRLSALGGLVGLLLASGSGRTRVIEDAAAAVAMKDPVSDSNLVVDLGSKPHVANLTMLVLGFGHGDSASGPRYPLVLSDQVGVDGPQKLLALPVLLF